MNDTSTGSSPVIIDVPFTDTLKDLKDTEELCRPLLQNSELTLQADKHIAYLKKMLGTLPSQLQLLDASQPWLVFWCVNALALLGEDVSYLSQSIAVTILRCQCEGGGFGGGPGQSPHIVATYAAIMSLAFSPESWPQINFEGMRRWLKQIKQEDGSFRVSKDGETDPRASYCALAVAHILDIVDEELLDAVPESIARCQTYEGGFANVPLGEAHGGYAFCSVASLCFANRDAFASVNVHSLVRWLSARQGSIPGFTGRTNKLVDACYSHWAGGCWALIEQQLGRHDIWDRQGLQNYILTCAQSPTGGLRDKPNKPSDAYHTNYSICGLANAQYRYRYDDIWHWHAEPIKLQSTNSVKPLNPLFGTPLGVAEKMHKFFANH